MGEFFLVLVAIRQRQEKVYNLVYQMSGHKVYTAIAWKEYANDDTALHLEASLAPQHRLNTITGAALLMQCELQWFEVMLVQSLSQICSFLFLLTFKFQPHTHASVLRITIYVRLHS